MSDLDAFVNYQVSRDKFIPNRAVTLAPRVEAGAYRAMYDGRYGWHIQRVVPQNGDDLIDTRDDTYTSVMSDIRQFWGDGMKNKYSRFGMSYSRGILLYGPPGAGKSCLIANIIKEAVDLDAIIFTGTDPDGLTEVIHNIKEIEGDDRKLLYIIEELDSAIDDGFEGELLSILDGQDKISNMVCLATTNHIGKIPDRLKNRPGRFATVIEMGKPGNDVIEHYIRTKLSADDLDGSYPIEEWVSASDGLVLDQVKDMIVNVFCFGRTLTQARELVERKI